MNRDIETEVPLGRLPLNFHYTDGVWHHSAIGDVHFPENDHEETRILESDSFWYRHRTLVISFLIKKFSKTGLIVDIGGGTGYVAKSLQDLGFSTVLIEPTLAGAMAAKDRGVKSIVCSDIQPLFGKIPPIENICMFDVLEHLEDDVGMLKNLHSTMAEGGRLFLTIPAFQLLWSSEDIHAKHFRRYTNPSISLILKQCGFRILRRSYFFSYLFLPILLLRALPTYLHTYGESSAARTQKAHKGQSAGTSNLLNLFSKFELFLILKGIFIPFGSSILIVAEKISEKNAPV